jgi:uncharacterized PurR-regulated membrane protein YhhQ (DUF165 family)
MSIPAFVVVTVLALLAGVALRRRYFWRWAVPVSLFVGTLIGSIVYFSSAAAGLGPSAVAQRIVMVSAAPMLIMLQPVMGDTDPVVLAPLVPLLLALEAACLVLGLLVVARFVSKDKRFGHNAKE